MSEPSTIRIPTPRGFIKALRLGRTNPTSAQWEATFPDGSRKSYFGDAIHVRNMIEMETGVRA